MFKGDRLFSFVFLVAILAGAAFGWYQNIPTPEERRWETYCYCHGEQAQFINVPLLGHNNWFVKVKDGQPGWWYLRGEPRTEESSCLLFFYWYQRDLDGDGIKEKGWPHAEFVDDEFDHCCKDNGF